MICDRRFNVKNSFPLDMFSDIILLIINSEFLDAEKNNFQEQVSLIIFELILFVALMWLPIKTSNQVWYLYYI